MMPGNSQRRLLKRQKTGLLPGTMVHIGERKRENIRVSVFTYQEGRLEERILEDREQCRKPDADAGVTWVNIDGLHAVDAIGTVGKQYGLHPLLMEDIVNTEQRPKIEDNGNHLFMVLKMLKFDEANKTILSEQISFVLGDNFLLTFQEDDRSDVFEAVRDHLRTDKGRIRKEKADYLAYALLDAIVDHYFVVLERIGEQMEVLEEKLLYEPDAVGVAEIHRLKREMIFLRKSVWPLREVMSALDRSESPLILDSTKLYVRDLYDHTVQVLDTVETFRDVLSGMLDLYISSESNKMNSVMKVLTIIATLFIPLTFIVGVYGMNFRVMPELEWEYGYPALWGIMIAVTMGMLVFFRKKKWL